MIVGLIIGAVAGFVAGVLVGRRNKKTVETVVSEVNKLVGSSAPSKPVSGSK